MRRHRTGRIYEADRVDGNRRSISDLTDVVHVIVESLMEDDFFDR